MELSGIWLWVALLLPVLWLFGNMLTGPLQHLFIFHPRTLPDDHVFQHPLPSTEYWISVPARGHVNALRFSAEEPAKGTVLFFHGNASTLNSWGKTYEWIVASGYHLVLYDYRGYGKSTGRRNQQILYQDAEAIYDWLAQREDPRRIILYGRSMGSAFACRVAAHRPCRHVILETPFSSMRDLFYTYYPFLPRLFFFRYKLPSRDYLAQVSAPVTIFQGTADYIVPYRNARKLVGALKPGDHFVKIEGGGHRDLFQYDRFRKMLMEILD